MKRVWLFVIGALMVLGTLQGALATINAHGGTIGSTGSHDHATGFNVTVNYQRNLTNITQSALSTATNASIYWATNQSLVATQAYSSNVATFPGGVIIEAGVPYFIVSTNGIGSSYTLAYGAVTAYPYTGAGTPDVNWTQKVIQTGASTWSSATDFLYSVVSVGTEPLATPPASPFTAVLLNNVTGQQIGNVSIQNVTGSLTLTYYNITNDGFCVSYTGNGTGSNCTDTGNGYGTFYNVTYTGTISSSDTVTTSAYQALLNITATSLYTNTSVTTFNLTNNKTQNLTGTGTSATIKALVTNNTILLTPAGNYSLNGTCEVTTPLTTVQCAIPGVYDAKLQVGGLYAGSLIQNFTLITTNTSLSIANTTNTTQYNITLDLLQGYSYFLQFQGDGYAYQNHTFTTSQAYDGYNFTLVLSNILNVSFYDENNGSLIAGPNITLQLISDYQSATFSTTTGQLSTTVLYPTTFTLFYSSANYTDRTYQFTLTNNTAVSLNLTMLLATQATEATVNVFNDLGINLEGYQVKVLKKDIPSNTYLVTQIITTDSNGQGTITINLGTDLYYFIVETSGNTVLTTNPAYLYSTTINLLVTTPNTGFTGFLQQYDVTGSISNASYVYTFTWNDPDNIATQGCIIAWLYTYNDRTQYNSTCASSSSGSATLTILNSTSAYYVIQGVVMKNGGELIIATVIADFKSLLTNEANDKMGVFIMFFVLLLIILLLRESLRWMIIFGSFVPLLFSILGLTNFGVGLTGMLWLGGIIVGVVVGD